MINDHTKQKPCCKFRKESISENNEEIFEDREVPHEFLSTEIVRRTERICGFTKDRVSSEPIILR